jgi:DNA invertase Pin-like site-specific DNA recombinase
MRVSKVDGSQVLDLQRDALINAGIAERNIYSDTASGKLDNRPGLESCLKALRAGDTLVVWKLDRLGCSLRHLVNVVHDLTKQNIGLRVLTGQVPRSAPPPPPASLYSASLPRSLSLSAS